MINCVIFAGGDPVERKTVDFNLVNNSFVISADSGFTLADKLGINSDLVIGDFDSLEINPNELSKCGKVKKYPPEKDDTDLILAIKAGFNEGCNNFIIYGALGGRFDHTMAGIQALAFILSNGGQGKIISDSEIIMLVSSGNYEIKKINDRYLSLFSYSPRVEGLNISGCEYCLQNSELNNEFPLGVSNIITADKAEISFSKGKLLIIQSQKN